MDAEQNVLNELRARLQRLGRPLPIGGDADEQSRTDSPIDCCMTGLPPSVAAFLREQIGDSRRISPIACS